jgi:hypothetical protein
MVIFVVFKEGPLMDTPGDNEYQRGCGEQEPICGHRSHIPRVSRQLKGASSVQAAQ